MMKTNMVQQSNNATPNMNCPVNDDALQQSNNAALNIGCSADLHRFCLNDKANINEMLLSATEITFDDIVKSDHDYYNHKKLACSPKKLIFNNNNSFSNYQTPVDSLRKSNQVPFLNLDSIKQNTNENEEEPSALIANNQEIET